MTLSLHTAVIGTYEQMLPQAAHLIDKAEELCAANSIDPSEIAGASLAPDMWPFAKQIEQILHHSGRALQGVRNGTFSPKVDTVPSDYPAMRGYIAEARETVASFTPDELERLANKDVEFVYSKLNMTFVASDFLLTFSLPNFYFHVATAYDILRSRGAKVGKMDYLGKPRVKK